MRVNHVVVKSLDPQNNKIAMTGPPRKRIEQAIEPIWDQARDRSRAQVSYPVRDQVNANMSDRVCGPVYDQVYDQMCLQVGTS